MTSSRHMQLTNHFSPWPSNSFHRSVGNVPIFPEELADFTVISLVSCENAYHKKDPQKAGVPLWSIHCTWWVVFLLLHSRFWCQFDSLIIMSLDLNVFNFILFGIHWSSCMYRLIFFHRIWQVLGHYLFTYSFCLLLFSVWHSLCLLCLLRVILYHCLIRELKAIYCIGWIS